MPEILLNHSEFKRKAMGMQLATAASVTAVLWIDDCRVQVRSETLHSDRWNGAGLQHIYTFFVYGQNTMVPPYQSSYLAYLLPVCNFHKVSKANGRAKLGCHPALVPTKSEALWSKSVIKQKETQRVQTLKFTE